MATADAALEWMRERIGIGESPPGSNHNSITDLWGLGDVAWCAETVSLALNNAWGDQERWQVPGVRPDYLLGFAYVPNLRLAFMAAGLYDTTPRVGAVVIYAWGPGSPIGDHTGLVEQVVGDGTIVALEGNTGSGGGDLLRQRRSMAVIDGFGHPPYTPTPPPEEDDLTPDEHAMLEHLYQATDADQTNDARFAELNGKADAASAALARIEAAVARPPPSP